MELSPQPGTAVDHLTEAGRRLLPVSGSGDPQGDVGRLRHGAERLRRLRLGQGFILFHLVSLHKTTFFWQVDSLSAVSKSFLEAESSSTYTAAWSQLAKGPAVRAFSWKSPRPCCVLMLSSCLVRHYYEICNLIIKSAGF